MISSLWRFLVQESKFNDTLTERTILIVFKCEKRKKKQNIKISEFIILPTFPIDY
jgi:hypothetical protein